MCPILVQKVFWYVEKYELDEIKLIVKASAEASASLPNLYNEDTENISKSNTEVKIKITDFDDNM